MSHHLALAVALLAAGLPGCTMSESFDEWVAAEEGGSLRADFRFDAGEATVEVMSHDAAQVRVAFDAVGWGASGVKIKLEGKGEDVRLSGRNGGLAPWLFGGPSVDVRVWVPRQFSVAVNSQGAPLRLEDLSGRIFANADSGDLVVDGAEGTIDLRTSRGSVRLENFEGEARIHSGRGGIEVAWMNGDLQAETDRGRIEVREVNGSVDVTTARGGIEIRGVEGSVKAETQRGGVELRDVSGRVEARSARGGIRATFTHDPEGSLETGRGTIDVALPMDAGVDLDARASRGDVSIGSGLRFEGEKDDGHWVGRVNGGGPSLRLHSARGGVRLSRR